MEPSDALAVEEFERAIAQHRESPVTYTKFDGMIERIELDEGHLRLHTFEGAPGDEHPHLNGYPIEVVTDWSLEGDQWQATEVSRVDTTPEPEPVPEPEPFVEEGPIPVWGVDGEYLYEVSPEGFDAFLSDDAEVRCEPADMMDPRSPLECWFPYAGG